MGVENSHDEACGAFVIAADAVDVGRKRRVFFAVSHDRSIAAVGAAYTQDEKLL